MGKLTTAQKDELRIFLAQQGLSFKPLQDEMLDHIGCDLEERMNGGVSFHDAWHQLITELPGNHFQLIQKDVMETINKRFTLSRGLSFVAISLLVVSTLFKIMHLQFAGEVLLLSFGFIAASLVTTSLSGIFLNKEKKGGVRVLAEVIGIVVLLIGYGFKILHLAGADGVILVAVVLLITSLLVNTVYVYQNASGEGNFLTFLLEKYTPGIERFFLFLLLPMVVYEVMSIILQTDDAPGQMILLVVIFGSGLYFIALTWRVMEKELRKRNAFTLAATIMSCLCLTLPFLGAILPFEIRVIIVSCFSIVSGFLAYKMEEDPKTLVHLSLSCVVPVLFIGWALIRFNIIPYSSHWYFFNLPILTLLVIGLFLCRKHGTMRAFMIVSLGGYLTEYIDSLRL